jgi:hypothetical protein
MRYIAIQMKNPCRASLDWSIKREKQNLIYPPKWQRVRFVDKVTHELEAKRQKI